MAAGRWPLLRSIARGCLAGALIGVTVNDRYASILTVRGSSMHPTFEPHPAVRVLVDRLCLDARYGFSRGDVVVFRSPTEHRSLVVKRLIALPGDWIQVPAAQEIRQIPEGHCWVEGDSPCSRDSRSYGPIPLGLMQGRVTYIVWPPNRIGPVERKMPEGRVMQR
ncbi:mitochondrial inner membrane protease subunit 2-like isoform X2 [Oryza brachyantha]|uniref:Mitochondrial inner membrane protease subunit 2 n=1 Tax=Oryza brachyantha TaxID=4533 RepID=J3LVL3_ORYBR|nr:mitochondrial inner membrane protease subunit 2-like isoform X2 [Oryza brachyantha]AHW98513.1 ossigP3 [Oryza brachyantha]